MFTTNLLIDMLIECKANGQVFSLTAPFSLLKSSVNQGVCGLNTVIVLVNHGACLLNRERSVFFYRQRFALQHQSCSYCYFPAKI